MEIKRGIPVSPGVAIGPAMVLDTEWFRIPHHALPADALDEEVQRLHLALAAAAAEAREKEGLIRGKLGPEYGAIFEAHARLTQDPALAAEIEKQIVNDHHTAAYSVSKVIRRRAKALMDLNHGHFAARSVDLFDIEKAVLRHLLGHRREELRHLSEPVIVLSHDLTPGETAVLDPKFVHAFATEAGGRASHTAIMAGALEIPAVVGLGKFVMDISGGDLVIVDGNHGLLILNPDPEMIAKYERTYKTLQTFEHRLEALRDEPAVTTDGTVIQLLGNIEFPHEAKHCLERGADGVGLYRTEFLYLGAKADPTEEEHLQAYREVVSAVRGRPVVIRTLDLGADKFATNTDLLPEERNPFLGVRSVRLCLRNLTLFKTQLRAILRASVFGDVRIMFPMVSTLLELRQCKMILAEVKEDLEDEGIECNQKLPVGTMIEVPSAALLADLMAREVNFFSIGTNDLTQYTLAADRTNENVAALYSPGDPAVLRLIEQVIQAAKHHDVEVNVCGEMSGEPIYTILLVGMGLRQLSVTPHNIPEIKQIIRSISVTEAKQIAQETRRLETARDVNNFLREQTRRVLPEVLD
jgi:phosphoenolpyruvate-protein phosphotransferase (PTS system enzyme I)